MQLDEYLRRFVEGYLFGDFASMARAEHDASIGGGGCGYPLTSAALSAIETVGFMLRSDGDVAGRPGRKCPQCERIEPYQAFLDGRANVAHYWGHVLAVLDPAYDRGAAFIPALIVLVRNPLAHGVVTAPSISVYNGLGAPHLVPDPLYADILAINARRLADDVRRSYQELVPRILAGQPHRFPGIAATRDSMQRRIKEIQRHYAGLEKKHRSALAIETTAASATTPSRLTPSLNMSAKHEITTIQIASRHPGQLGG